MKQPIEEEQQCSNQSKCKCKGCKQSELIISFAVRNDCEKKFDADDTPCPEKDLLEPFCKGGMWKIFQFRHAYLGSDHLGSDHLGS